MTRAEAVDILDWLTLKELFDLLRYVDGVRNDAEYLAKLEAWAAERGKVGVA